MPEPRHPKCSQHQHASLTSEEKLSLTAAIAITQNSDPISPNTAAVIIGALRRLSHELDHAHWGSLECDQKETYPE